MEIRKVSIIGMGALGILYGDYFSRKLGIEYIEFVADEDRIRKYKKHEIYCNNLLCDFPVVSGDEKDKPADLLIFAVKATALNSAILVAKNKVAENTIILSLLNGITSEEVIGETFGIDKILYCVAQGMDAVKVGNQLNYSNLGQLCIGIMDHEESKSSKLQAVVNFFQKAGLPFTVERDMKRRIWSKFMLNVGVNQTVMIYEGTYDTVQQNGEARELMKAAMKEVIQIAEKVKVILGEEDLSSYVKLLDTLNPDGMPSMRQDGLEKRKSEVELFSGTVISLGKKFGIITPVNQKMYHTILQMEREY